MGLCSPPLGCCCCKQLERRIQVPSAPGSSCLFLGQLCVLPSLETPIPHWGDKFIEHENISLLFPCICDQSTSEKSLIPFSSASWWLLRYRAESSLFISETFLNGTLDLKVLCKSTWKGVTFWVFFPSIRHTKNTHTEMTIWDICVQNIFCACKVFLTWEWAIPVCHTGQADRDEILPPWEPCSGL